MFEVGKPRWDQATLQGRIKHFVAQVDPRLLFYSQPDLQTCQAMLEAYKQGSRDHSDTELWRAQYAVFGRIHPDTGEAVPLPFSMPGFSPANIPVCTLMVLPGTSAVMGTFYQVLNQTMNAGFNYCNRNASKASSTSEMVAGYLGAVTSAVLVATSLRNLLLRTKRLSPALKRTLGTFLPFPAVATASMTNIVLMRVPEAINGIEVFNEDGSSAGISKKAGRDAIAATAASRIVMASPIFVMPPLGIAILERSSNLLKRFPRARLPLTVMFSTLGLYVGIPLAVACSPQVARLPAEKLEPGCTPTGSAVFYNKGL